MKKINSKNELNGKLDVIKFQTPNYEGEVYAAINVFPANWKPGNKISDLSKRSNIPMCKSSLNAIEDYLLHRRVVIGDFDLYTNISETKRTGSIGQVVADHKPILDAVKAGMKVVALNVPMHGRIKFELPKVETTKGVFEYRVVSPYLNMFVNGLDSGKLDNTDKEKDSQLNTFHYHNALRTLANGDQINMYVGYREDKFNNTINKTIHDKAARMIAMLSDEDLDITALNEQKKEDWLQHEKNKQAKNKGEKVERALNSGEASEALKNSQANVIAVIINGEQMNNMEVPNGDYKFADENGRVYGAIYSVNTNADRRGLAFRTRDGEKAFLVKVTR